MKILKIKFSAILIVGCMVCSVVLANAAESTFSGGVNSAPDLASSNVITAARFSDYGYAPTPTQIPETRKILYMASGDSCSYLKGTKVGIIDTLYIYNNSAYVINREKAVFNDSYLREAEFFAFKSVGGSMQVRAEELFKKMLKSEGDNIYFDLQEKITETIKTDSRNSGIKIYFSKNTIPILLEKCVNIKDVSQSITQQIDKSNI